MTVTQFLTAGLRTAILGFMASGALANPAPPLVISHVNVDTMAADGSVLRDQAVVIRDGRIESIATRVPRLPGAKLINGAGKWLMPGLVDMHVHVFNDRIVRIFTHTATPVDGATLPQDIFTPYIANGVTQIFDLSAMSETIGQNVEIEAGRLIGPHIAMAALIDGANPIWPSGMSQAAATPEDGRQAVRDAAGAGYGFIKVYSKLDLLTFTAIVDEARKLKMRVVGHIPQREQGTTDKFFQPGFDLVVHAEEFAQQTYIPDDLAIPRYVEMSKRNGTSLIATLTLDERLVEETMHPETLESRAELRTLPAAWYHMVTLQNPYVARADAKWIAAVQKTVAFNRKLVKAFDDAGIAVLAGTDAPVPGLAPGFALHDELEALVRAGLSNRRALEGATRLAAEWLGVVDDRGTVAVGKRADLLLLDADPLTDVANTRRISAVVVGGHYFSRADLDARMAGLTKRNLAAR